MALLLFLPIFIPFVWLMSVMWRRRLKRHVSRVHNEYWPRLHGTEAETARTDPNKPTGACCNNEQRGPNGGCSNCGDPCY